MDGCSARGAVRFAEGVRSIVAVLRVCLGIVCCICIALRLIPLQTLTYARSPLFCQSTSEFIH